MSTCLLVLSRIIEPNPVQKWTTYNDHKIVDLFVKGDGLITHFISLTIVSAHKRQEEN
jgi:hypothetical protein